MKFLVLGATGMAGHVVYQYLLERKHEVIPFSRQKVPLPGVIIGDVRDLALIQHVVDHGAFDYIINCVGILNQAAEEEQEAAVFLNAYLPHYLVKITQKLSTAVIHMSTDCVFSGAKGNYQEKDIPDGITFYDRSKALGEFCDGKNLVFRNSIIGPDQKEAGIGLFNWFMKRQGTIRGYTKAIWSGVTTLVLAQAIEQAACQHLTGLYHLTNSQQINKYELLELFNHYFCEDEVKIQPVDGVCVDKSLINSRKDFDFSVPSYDVMVRDMKEWIDTHRILYPHYAEKGNSI